jgi:hypothetical protein
MRQSGDQGRVFFRMKDGERVIAKSEYGGGLWRVRGFGAEDDPLMAKVKAVEKSEGEVSNGLSDRGEGERVSLIHVRRMREISGREMRWRAR